ncbi:MAG: DUF5123 domain-containing protein [Prolixibacteraceae bacterium]
MDTTIKNLVIIGLLFLLPACEDKIDPLVEELQFERVFSPLELKAHIRNKTTVELTWNVRDDAEAYMVEISEDNFATIAKTATVTPDQLPYSAALIGETQYAARVKGTAETLEDSKWAVVTFLTEPENILERLAGPDIQANSVTLKWPASSEVTNFVIMPGSTTRAITAEEKAAGAATITGLTGETEYTVRLMKDTKQRGTLTFTTYVDPANATAVTHTDDLNAVIGAAAEGDVLVLWPGDYTVYSGAVILNKSIAIKGLYPYNKPIIHVQFNLENNVQAVLIKDVEMDGGTTQPNAFQYNSAGTFGSLEVSGCHIHDYARSLFANTSSTFKASIASITMNNCIATNMLTDGGDCIDFRSSYVARLILKNSTFNNCAPARDFIRFDDASATFPGMNSDVLIDHCTLYGVSNGTSRRILYVRFKTNTLTVTNTIIGATAGYYTNQTNSAQPECANNNYFNAPGFLTGGSTVSGAKFDLSGTHSLIDPGFAGAATGDFTLSNQTLIDNQIGDPRWITVP